MAHYAIIDPSTSIVIDVFVGKEETDTSHDWEQYYATPDVIVRRTSYNTHGGIHYDWETGKPSADQTKAYRKNYAGTGYTYDAERDAFIPPQPSTDCVLDEGTCVWVCPEP
jgi:hypothetical protein